MSEAFSLDEIERLARLARLALTDAEKRLFARQLADVLAYAEQIQSVDTAGVAPTSHPHGPAAGWRADDVQPSLGAGLALEQAPEADRTAGLFKVPRVLGS